MSLENFLNPRSEGRHQLNFARYPVSIGTQKIFSGCYRSCRPLLKVITRNRSEITGQICKQILYDIYQASIFSFLIKEIRAGFCF